MKTLARLALAAAAVAFAAAIMGSWTRITGDGMSCPQWPACRLAAGTVWEWLHRALVALELPLVAAVLLTAWRRHRAARFIPATGLAVLVLFTVQVALGAATVHLANSPMSVVWHWGTAMAFIAALLSLAIVASFDPAAATKVEALPRLSVYALAATSAAAYLTMCVGAYVSSSGAGLACLSLASCAGNVVVTDAGQFVQMLHRGIAAVTLLLGAATLTLCLRATPHIRSLASLGLGLLFVQILLGLFNVALHLPLALREAHAANAALTFIIYITAIILALVDRSRVSLLKLAA
ncbi:MAG: hypothetical protein DLM50_04260 [Candidatus Meridianibacter frigidus]|nr:MAG: hypothetical protein DLM50_04260 [Candidatus Eremiobacteraeota bacterium]